MTNKLTKEVNGFQIASSLEIDKSWIKVAVEGLVSIGGDCEAAYVPC